MKKFILLLLLMPVLAHSQQNKRKKICVPPRTQFIVCCDSPKVVVNVNPSATQQFALDPELRQAILKKLGEEEKTDWWNRSLNLFAIIAAAFAAWLAWRTLLRDKKYRDLAFTAEVDKLLIEHPELRGYDDNYKSQIKKSVTIVAPVKINVTDKEKVQIIGKHSFTITPLNKNPVKVSSGGITKTFTAKDNTTYQNVLNDETYEIENDAEIYITQCDNVSMPLFGDDLTKSKIRAFCYYMLNNFELALMHHDNKSIKPWESYLRHTYNKSSQFQELVINAQSAGGKKIFSTEFVNKLDDLFPENKTNSPVQKNGKLIFQ